MSMSFDPRVADYFFDEARIPLRLAAISKSGFPTIVSLWSLRENGRIYCATRGIAYIASKIAENPNVGFELSCEAPPYRGVRGWGKAMLVAERGPEILERLLGKFLGGVDSPLAKRLLEEGKVDEVAIKIEPLWMKTWDYSRRMKGSV